MHMAGAQSAQTIAGESPHFYIPVLFPSYSGLVPGVCLLCKNKIGTDLGSSKPCLRPPDDRGGLLCEADFPPEWWL